MKRGEFIKKSFYASLGGILLTEHLFGCNWNSLKSFPGELLGPSHTLGHRLRDANFPTSSDVLQIETVIIGGGISGMSAANELKKQGRDFRLLELDTIHGGNSRWGQNEVTKYPWGAHYLPLVNNSNTDLINWLHEIGVIESFDSVGKPIYNEEFLCHEKEDRLRMHGKWIEGLSPEFGVNAEEKKQLDRFHLQMHELKLAMGSDGKYFFDIPFEMSSEDEMSRKWDSISMQQWLWNEGYTTEPIHWLVDYSCRDDFGTTSAETSAWMGLHYFCSRRAVAANAESDEILAWPNGNGFLSEKLYEPIKNEVSVGHCVFAVEPNPDFVLINVFDSVNDRSYSIQAKSVIVASPLHVVKYWGDYWRNKLSPIEHWIDHTPWMVANITLKNRPAGEMAWDNVPYKGKSLGYVDATHQHAGLTRNETVVTLYMPFSEGSGREVRQSLHSKTHAEWCEIVVAEMKLMHSDIEDLIGRIDVWMWGHPMIKMRPGFLFNAERNSFYNSIDSKITFAHTDTNGISIFEEAYYLGLKSARKIISSNT
jgi:hypothetical protein